MDLYLKWVDIPSRLLFHQYFFYYTVVAFTLSFFKIFEVKRVNFINKINNSFMI